MNEANSTNDQWTTRVNSSSYLVQAKELEGGRPVVQAKTLEGGNQAH